MLILQRKAEEAILIGDHLNSNSIRIVVLAVEGSRVKLGIDAPPDVLIVREELIDNPDDVGRHHVNQRDEDL